MKRLILLFIVVLAGVNAFGQTDAQLSAVASSANPNAEYRLFPTTNMYTFLKLNTATGQIYQLQYGMDDTNRMIVPLSVDILTAIKPLKPGTFTLYPTTNMWTFILVDQVAGNCWQVQWNIDKDKRMIAPIPNYPNE
jgi:hypothetical protein